MIALQCLVRKTIWAEVGGVKTRKVWGGAVQCGRGQGNAQEMRTRCEQRTETFGAVRAEDKNFLPATSLIGILCRLTWLT